MTPVRGALVAAACAALALGAATSARADAPAPAAAEALAAGAAGEPEAGGTHWRIATERGPVHVWIPAGHDPARSGIVVYVHGYFTTLDDEWTKNHLAEQFAASGVDAVFVAPSAPAKFPDAVPWRSLPNLLDTVRRALGRPLPTGRFVVVGHSGAFRTIAEWLAGPWRPSATIALVDGLYHNDDDFRNWVLGVRGRRLILVGGETTSHCERLFARNRRWAERREGLPKAAEALDRAAREARILYFASRVEHFELVSGGTTIPLILRLTSLPRLDAAPQPRGTMKSRTADSPAL